MQLTIENFIKWASECEKTYGSRPSAVTLNPADVNDIYDGLMSDSYAASHVPAPSETHDRIATAQQRRDGYCMTLVGVDVYRSASVPVGTFGLD